MMTSETPFEKKLVFWQQLFWVVLPCFAGSLSVLAISGLISSFARRVGNGYLFAACYAAGLVASFILLLLIYLFVESCRKRDTTLQAVRKIFQEHNAIITKKTKPLAGSWAWTAVLLAIEIYKGFLVLLVAAAGLALYMLIRGAYELFTGNMMTALVSAFLFLGFAGSVGAGLVLIKWFAWEVSKIAGVMASQGQGHNEEKELEPRQQLQQAKQEKLRAQVRSEIEGTLICIAVGIVLLVWNQPVYNYIGYGALALGFIGALAGLVLWIRNRAQ